MSSRHGSGGIFEDANRREYQLSGSPRCKNQAGSNPQLATYMQAITKDDDPVAGAKGSIDLSSLAIQDLRRTRHPIGRMQRLVRLGDRIGLDSLSRLLRFLIRLRRWVRHRLGHLPVLPVLHPLTPAELDTAFEACVRVSQQAAFVNELTFLEKRNAEKAQNKTPAPFPFKGPLRALDPFLCPAGIIRVGVRLDHSELPFNEKHPPILDGLSELATLIISSAHNRALHGGFRSTYSFALKRAWLIGGKRRIRHFIQRCDICARFRAAPLTQMLAALLPALVTPSRAFARTGLDYAGPFHVLPSKGHGIRTTKAYVAVFVCMASKAVHLEPIGDLTTKSLKGALIRFCGRRAMPAEIWSDNATNFHRADLDLREAFNQESLDWNAIKNHLATEGVTWKFIPPAAPYFGGLWEAAVRSFKTHLKKVIGPKHLTFEEFATLLVSVEVVLNCRPLGPISGDPDDLRACTPGHLLVGNSRLTIPETPVEIQRTDNLQHWEFVEGLRAKFWQQWSREYFNTLQHRCKWTHRTDNLRVGDLVLVLDAALLRPTRHWPVGRITEVHPGRDGLVRAATMKTEQGAYVRPIVKPSLLPIDNGPRSESVPASTATPSPRRAGPTSRTRHGGRRC